MSWIKKYWSIILNVILIVAVLSSAWPEETELADLSVYTQNNLDKSIGITPGMDAKNVIEIMGPPAVKEIEGNKEELHYCKTGHLVDEYIAIILKEGKVTNMSFYVVNWLDVAFHHTQTPTEELIEVGGLGDCKLTIRWGTYGQRTPNKPMQPISNAPSD